MSKKKKYRLTDPKKFGVFMVIVIVFLVILFLLLRSCILSPSETDPNKTNSKTESKLDHSQSGKQDSSKSDSSKSDNSKSDSSKPDNSKPDNSKPDSSKPDNSKSDSSKSDNSKSDNSKPSGAYSEPSIQKTVSPIGTNLVSWLDAILTITEPVGKKSSTKQKYTIVIDPALGGDEKGFVSGSVTEKDINLSVAEHLIDVLRESYPEIRVLATRTQDVAMTVKERLNMINSSGANLAVSLQCARQRDGEDANGITTLFRKSTGNETTREVELINASKNLASQLQKQTVAYSGAIGRGFTEAEEEILKADIPLAILNMGYLSNKDDYARLTDDKTQKDLACGIAEAISKTLKKK